MSAARAPHTPGLAQRLAEAEATIEALLSGQIDAVVDSKSQTPVLLAKAQEALRASEQRYRRIVETTSDGIFTTDTEFNLTFANRRLAEMLGCPIEEMLGQSLFRFFPEAPGAGARVWRERSHEGIVEEHEGEFVRQDGTSVFAQITGSSLVDGQGRYVGSMAVVRDITERKKLRSQLMVSDRMASVGTLAAGVAHEINNPLAALIVNLEYVTESLSRMTRSRPLPLAWDSRDGWFQDEVIKPMEETRAAAERVRAIVRDLNMFSRSSSNEPQGSANVKNVLDSSLRMAWNEIRHRARVVKHYGPLPPVAISEGRLGQLFLNLIVNATQALPEGHAAANQITVSTRREGDRVVVEVSDTGAGIPPETIGRIFDAFYTTKAIGVGTGLGLAICHRIVSDVGGELTVKSEVGKGTTFRVTLPISDQETKAPLVPAPEAVVAPRRGRILLVDDEKLVVSALKRILSAEHDVTATVAAKDALALCAGGQEFDVIVCDLMMPEMTGMELYGALRTVAPEQAARMVFLTGGAFTTKAQEFLAETQNEHLEKPFDPVNFRALVQRHLQSQLTAIAK